MERNSRGPAPSSSSSWARARYLLLLISYAKLPDTRHERGMHAKIKNAINAIAVFEGFPGLTRDKSRALIAFMHSLFDEALQTSKKRLRTSSEQVYRSMWASLCEGLRGASEPPTLHQLQAALAIFQGYATRRKALGLLKWVAKTAPQGAQRLGDRFEALEHEYVERPAHHYALNTREDILRAMLEKARAVRGWKGVRLQTLLRVLWDTGLRQEELLGMTWGHIDVAASSLKVPGRPARYLALSGPTVEALAYWKLASPATGVAHVWVADESGKLLNASTLWRQLKRVEPPGTPLELSLSGPTAFRAAFAWRCLQQGLEVEEIQQRLGHARLSSTESLLAQLTAHNTSHAATVEQTQSAQPAQER